MIFWYFNIGFCVDRLIRHSLKLEHPSILIRLIPLISFYAPLYENTRKPRVYFVFREYRNRTMTWNGFMSYVSCMTIAIYLRYCKNRLQVKRKRNTKKQKKAKKTGKPKFSRTDFIRFQWNISRSLAYYVRESVTFSASLDRLTTNLFRNVEVIFIFPLAFKEVEKRKETIFFFLIVYMSQHSDDWTFMFIFVFIVQFLVVQCSQFHGSRSMRSIVLLAVHFLITFLT